MWKLCFVDEWWLICGDYQKYPRTLRISDCINHQPVSKNSTTKKWTLALLPKGRYAGVLPSDGGVNSRDVGMRSGSVGMRSEYDGVLSGYVGMLRGHVGVLFGDGGVASRDVGMLSLWSCRNAILV